MPFPVSNYGGERSYKLNTLEQVQHDDGHADWRDDDDGHRHDDGHNDWRDDDDGRGHDGHDDGHDDWRDDDDGACYEQDNYDETDDYGSYYD